MSARPSGATAPALSPTEAIKEALASTRLEGLEPSDEVLADAELVAAGEIDTDELVARTLARHQR